MKRRAGLVALVLSLASCGGEEPRAGAAELLPAVYTTFYPTTYMAERIGGGAIPVVCPLPEGEDPIFWQPDRATLDAYQRAALVVVNGAGFEKWVEGASLPLSRVVDTAIGFEDQWLQFEGTTTHSHGAAGEHTHAGIDGHTWLDPELARAQARALLAGMQRAFPASAEALRANHAALDRDLAALDAEWRELAPTLAAANLLASHPAYNYVARRYGLAIQSFDLDPAERAPEEDLAALRAGLDAGRVNLLWWESPPVEGAVALEGLREVVVSPCESLSAEDRAAGRSYLDVMRENLERLRAALDG